MPTEKDQEKNRKKLMDVLGGLPVPVPGSAARILESVRKTIMDSDEKKKKSQEKK